MCMSRKKNGCRVFSRRLALLIHTDCTATSICNVDRHSPPGARDSLGTEVAFQMQFFSVVSCCECHILMSSKGWFFLGGRWLIFYEFNLQLFSSCSLWMQIHCFLLEFQNMHRNRRGELSVRAEVCVCCCCSFNMHLISCVFMPVRCWLLI